MRLSLIAVVLLAGCAGSLIKVPKDASVVRCTEYNGNTAAPIGAAVQANGCQCYQQGEMKGRVVYRGDACELELETE